MLDVKRGLGWVGGVGGGGGGGGGGDEMSGKALPFLFHNDFSIISFLLCRIRHIKQHKEQRNQIRISDIDLGYRVSRYL